MKKKYIVISSMFLIGFLVLTGFVLANGMTRFDENIYHTVIQLRNPFFDNLFKTITKLGNIIPVFCITIFLLILLKRKERTILGIEIILNILSNQILKHIIKRIRPDHLRLIKQGGYSYPSGHAMISVAIYGFLIYLVYKKVHNRILKTILMILLILSIIGIGISRIYLGVHYPSDVIAGFVLAIPILLLIVTIFEQWGNYDEKDGCQ